MITFGLADLVAARLAELDDAPRDRETPVGALFRADPHFVAVCAGITNTFENLPEMLRHLTDPEALDLDRLREGRRYRKPAIRVQTRLTRRGNLIVEWHPAARGTAAYDFLRLPPDDFTWPRNRLAMIDQVQDFSIRAEPGFRRFGPREPGYTDAEWELLLHVQRAVQHAVAQARHVAEVRETSVMILARDAETSVRPHLPDRTDDRILRFLAERKFAFVSPEAAESARAKHDLAALLADRDLDPDAFMRLYRDREFKPGITGRAIDERRTRPLFHTDWHTVKHIAELVERFHPDVSAKYPRPDRP